MCMPLSSHPNTSTYFHATVSWQYFIIPTLQTCIKDLQVARALGYLFILFSLSLVAGLGLASWSWDPGKRPPVPVSLSLASPSSSASPAKVFLSVCITHHTFRLSIINAIKNILDFLCTNITATWKSTDHSCFTAMVINIDIYRWWCECLHSVENWVHKENSMNHSLYWHLEDFLLDSRGNYIWSMWEV